MLSIWVGGTQYQASRTLSVLSTGSCDGGGVACPLSLLDWPAGGGEGILPILTADGCAWTASASDSWITITEGASGDGSGAVSYQVAANTGAGRIGGITVTGVDGDTVYAITQTGVGAKAGLPPTGEAAARSQADRHRSATLVAPRVSSNACGATKMESARATAAALGAADPDMLAAGCSFSVFDMPATGGNRTVSVITEAGCGWSATASDSWITVTGGLPGSGAGELGYAVSQNRSRARFGSIVVLSDDGERAYAIAQAGSSQDVVHWDDFETGDLSGWSAAVP